MTKATEDRSITNASAAMQVVLGLTLLSVLASCSDPRDHTGGGKLTMTSHRNGRLAWRGYLFEGIRVGDWMMQQSSGMREVGRYENGKREGVWSLLTPAGFKYSERTYKDGDLVN